MIVFLAEVVTIMVMLPLAYLGHRGASVVAAVWGSAFIAGWSLA